VAFVIPIDEQLQLHQGCHFPHASYASLELPFSDLFVNTHFCGSMSLNLGQKVYMVNM